MDVDPCARRQQHRNAIGAGAKTAATSSRVPDATVYPRELPPLTTSAVAHARPFRVADPAAYRRRKAAIDAAAAFPELPSIATLALTSTMPTVSTSFAGLGFPDSMCGPDCEPPDTQVAAGPDQVFEVINVAGMIYDKSGNTLLAAFNLNHLFNQDPALFSSDPRIEYDTISGRWFVSLLILDTTDITTAQNGSFNLAVSNDSNPLDGFNVYPIETPGDFPDQPSLGFNDDKVVTGGNSFSCNPNCNAGPYEGNEFLVWNKSELLAGDATDRYEFLSAGRGRHRLPDHSGQEPIVNLDALDALGFRHRAESSGPPTVLDELNIWAVTGVPSVGSGSSATDTIVTITDFNDPPSAQQKNGSGVKIDTGDQRLLDAVYRDGHLWASGNDQCKPSGDTTQRSCLQYFRGADRRR